MRIARWIGRLLLLSPLLWLPQSQADTVDDGYEAYQRKDWTTAYENWYSAAQAGDHRAQFYLSVLYSEGKGVAQSPDLAKNWLTRSAEGGFPPAQFNLGNWHQQGDWVERDDSLSAHWWQQAANQGFERAQYNLASLYYLGKGVEQDLGQAVYWYRMAAMNGSEKAREMLERMGLPLVQKPVNAAENQASDLIVESVSARLSQFDSNNKNKQIEHKSDLKNDDSILSGEDRSRKYVNQDWVFLQPDDRYTVQVFASDKYESAVGIANQHTGAEELAIFRYARFGEDWYAVIIGSYADLEEAKTAVEAFPQEFQENRPWIKRFRVIKEAMAQQRN